MSPGPIPWSDVKEYAVFYGYSEEQLEDLLYHINEMDREYFSYLKDSSKNGKK